MPSFRNLALAAWLLLAACASASENRAAPPDASATGPSVEPASSSANAGDVEERVDARPSSAPVTPPHLLGDTPVHGAGDWTGTPQSNTVVGLQTRSVSSSAPSTGNTLGWSGAAWAPSPVNLAGGANYVTGTLPVGNLPNGTPDWTGAITSNTVVQAQAGAIAFGTQGQMTCATADTTCSWTQASTSSATPATATITPQISTAGSNQAGSNLTVALSTPTGSGAKGAFAVTANGADALAAGLDPGNTGLYDVWSGVTTPSTTNWMTQSNGTYLNLNTPTSAGTMYFTGGNGPVGEELIFASSVMMFGLALNTWNAQFFAAAQDFAGGVSVLSLGAATTPPTALPTTSIGLYNASGQLLGVNSAGITAPYQLAGPFLVQQTTAPSTSGGSGSAGAQWQFRGMNGQPATGASNNGGAGGIGDFRGGAGATSALANAGAGANGQFGGGGGGAATGGTGNGGQGGDSIVFGGGGGATTGGTAGGPGAVRLRLGGIAGADQLVVAQNSSGTRISTFTSGLELNTVTKSANYTIDNVGTNPDIRVYVDSTAAVRTITLPAPTSGRTVEVVDLKCQAATHNITVAQHASETIGTLAQSYVIQVACASKTFATDGNNWTVQ